MAGFAVDVIGDKQRESTDDLPLGKFRVEGAAANTVRSLIAPH
jgi:hypothetical protein